jgi:hypothetical protein
LRSVDLIGAQQVLHAQRCALDEKWRRGTACWRVRALTRHRRAEQHVGQHDANAAGRNRHAHEQRERWRNINLLHARRRNVVVVARPVRRHLALVDERRSRRGRKHRDSGRLGQRGATVTALIGHAVVAANEQQRRLGRRESETRVALRLEAIACGERAENDANDIVHLALLWAA